MTQSEEFKVKKGSRKHIITVDDQLLKYHIDNKNATSTYSKQILYQNLNNKLFFKLKKYKFAIPFTVSGTLICIIAGIYYSSDSYIPTDPETTTEPFFASITFGLCFVIATGICLFSYDYSVTLFNNEENILMPIDKEKKVVQFIKETVFSYRNRYLRELIIRNYDGHSDLSKKQYAILLNNLRVYNLDELDKAINHNDFITEIKLVDKSQKHLNVKKTFSNFSYDIFSDRIEYNHKELMNNTSGVVYYESIGWQSTNKTSNESMNLIIGLSAILLGGIIMISNIGASDLTFFFVGLMGFPTGLLFILIFLSKNKKFIQIEGSETGINLYYNDNNYQEVQDFAKQVIKTRNEYLIKKFEVIENILPIEDKQNWVSYMYTQFVITKEQADIYMRRTASYRSEPKIGFKIPNKNNPT